MRFPVYAGASTALAVGVVAHAFNQRPNFYSASVYLSQSNLSVLVLLNYSLLLAFTTLWALTRTFYGRLRPVELEQLYERGWFAVTETALAMTIFRDELGAWFLVMFVALMAGRIWGWIGYGRVEVLEQQPPANPGLFHTRLTMSLALSLVFDVWMTTYALTTVIRQARPNMMVMFLFEFALLTTSSISTALRYVISVIDIRIHRKQAQELLAARRAEIRERREEMLRQRAERRESDDTAVDNTDLPHEDDIEEMDIEPPGWEAKGQWILSLDLVSDFVRLFIYCVFFACIATFFGLPIHIMRDLFMTARSFIKRLSAFLKYRNATKDMNNKYADATAEEIQREDTCIICREVMRPWAATNDAGNAANPPAQRSIPISERLRPKKLPCGHVLHLGCLKSWLERQQFCPTCRRPVIDRPAAANNAVPIPGRPAIQAAANPARQPAPVVHRQPGAPQQIVINREINIGPLRLAFGRGALPAGVPLPNQPHARVIGFGVGGEPARRDAPRGAHADAQSHPQPILGVNATQEDSSIDANIRRLERQINDEASKLEVHRAELSVLRQLQDELNRLRTTRILGEVGHIVPETASVYGAAYIPPPHTRGNLSGDRGQASSSSRGPMSGRITTTHRHIPIPGQVAIPSGSSDLPPGLVIPEGWSLLPLQNADDRAPANGTSSTQGAGRSSSAHVSTGASGASSGAAAAASASASTTPNEGQQSFVQPVEAQSGQTSASPEAQTPTAPQQSASASQSMDSHPGPAVETATATTDFAVGTETNGQPAPSISVTNESNEDDFLPNWGSSPPLPRTAGIDSGMNTPEIAAIPDVAEFNFDTSTTSAPRSAAPRNDEQPPRPSGVTEADLPSLPRTAGIDDGRSTPESFRMSSSSPEVSKDKGKGKEKQPSVEEGDEV